MEFLTKNQKRLMMTRDGTLESEWGEHITAEGKDVIVIGGGDTGTDSALTRTAGGGGASAMPRRSRINNTCACRRSRRSWMHRGSVRMNA